MTKYWNAEIVTFKKIYEKYHVLIKQHLNGTDMLKLSEVDKSFSRIAFGCDSCMYDYYVDFNIERMDDFDDLSNILQTKRRYRSFRFKCFDSKELTERLVRFLEIFGDRASTVEFTDMNVPEKFEDVSEPLYPLRYFKLTAFRGEFQVVVLQPFTRYEVLTFESNLHPIKMKTLTDQSIESRLLHFINSSFDLENFDYFKGNCTDFWIESNRKNEVTDLCRVLERSTDINELEITRKSSLGFFMKVNRKLNKIPPIVDVALFTRRKLNGIFAPTPKEPPPENQYGMFHHRTAARIMSSEESNDSCSTSKSEPAVIPKELFEISLEIHDLTPHVIDELSRSLPNLNSLKIFNISTRLIKRLFEVFKNLQTIKVTGREKLCNRQKFISIKPSLDPMMRLPSEALKLLVQHLDFYDCLSASMASKVWNGAFGTTESFTKKINIQVDYYDLKSNNVEVFHQSQRDYQNMEISCRNFENCTIQALELVNVFSAKLVELNLSELHLEKITNFKKRLTFPKLKCLRLNKVNDKCCFLLMQNCTTITTFAMSSMTILQYVVERLKAMESMKTLSLNDCNFDYFKTLRELQIGSLNFNLDEFELTFDHSNGWLTQRTPGFENFLRIFSIRNVKHFKASGLRGNILYHFIGHMFVLKTVDIKHVWENDLQDRNLKTLKEKFELQLTTLGMGESLDWRQIFPSVSVLRMKPSKYKSITDTDEMFIKLLRPSSEKMIMNRTYKLNKRALGVEDPIVMLSEELHQLVTQHLNRQDVLNCFEVAKTWNKFCSQSQSCSKKICLYIKQEDSEELKTAIKQSDRKFSNLICNFYDSLVIKTFRNLKRLTVTFLASEPFEPIELPLLEALIILKCPGKLYKPDQVQECFKMFAKCKRLSFLEIHEAITKENASSIIKMLENNKNLKTLKIHQCSEFYRLFSEDITPLISFKLSRLLYAIPEKFSIFGTKFERNFIKFLKQNDSLKVIDMNHISGEMMNTIFKNMKQIESLRYLRLSRFDLINLEANSSLKEFMLPNAPNFADRMVESSFDFQPFLKATPNLELLYIETVSNDLVEYVAKSLTKLKVLSCDRFDRRYNMKFYEEMKIDTKLGMNRRIKIRKVNFKRVNGEERSLSNLYGE